MIIYLSLLICVIGLLIWFVRPSPETNPKMAELGRIMFWVGLLAFLMTDQALLSVIRR
jgi:hypothetical protein